MSNETIKGEFEKIIYENKTLIGKLVKYDRFKPNFIMGMTFFIALVIAVVATQMLMSISISATNEMVRNLSLYLGSASLASIGLVVGALSITIGKIDFEMSSKLEENGREINAIRILYGFPFLAVLLFCASFLWFTTYVVMFSEKSINGVLIFLFTFVDIFFTIYSLLYCISLLDDILLLFCLSHLFSKSKIKD